MKKLLLLVSYFLLGLTGTLNLNAQVFDIALTNESEVDAFIAAMPGNGFVGVNTEKNSFGGTFGVKILANGSLTYAATGLAAGDYSIEATVMCQNPAVLPWTRDAWLTSGSAPTTSTPSEGTATTWVTLPAKTVTIPGGDYTFGIVRGGSGSQLFVSHFKVTFLGGGGPSSETDITSFSIAEQAAPATIDAGAHTVTMEVVNGTSLTSLSPTIGLSAGATVSPNSEVAQDFSGGPVSYTVTAEDGSTTQAWDVTVTEADPVAAGTIFEVVLNDEAEVDAFLAAVPGNGFVEVNTQKNSFQTVFGVKILGNGSLTYPATGLASGYYSMQADIMVQNTAVLPWVQDAWLTSGSAPVTSAPSEGTNNTFVTLTKQIFLSAGGDYTFGIVRGGTGSQLFVKGWKVTYLGTTLSTDDAAFKNNFTVSKTGVTLKDISGNVQIIDLLGRILLSKEVKNQEKLEFEFSSSTLYIVKVATASGTASRKVVFN